MRENEKIITEIKHHNSIPFRFNDFFTIPLFLFFSLILLILLKPDDKSDSNLVSLYYIFILPLVILIFIFLSIGRIFMRWYNLKTLNYILTNQRVLVIDSQLKNIIRTIELKGVEVEYTEKIDNSGYIVFEMKEIREYSFFHGVHGLNFFENSNVLYNINEVRQVYKMIIEQKSLLKIEI